MYITFAEAVQHLRDIVEEYGADHVNTTVDLPGVNITSCVYRDHNTSMPSCGVGHVLNRAGFNMLDIGNDDNYQTWTYLYRGLREERKLFMHTNTVRLLAEFQQQQDEQMTWGFALASALAAVNAPSVDEDVMPDNPS